ncbi:MAG TPA: hypothetical protein VGV89_00555 [Thermoplasmata archaeon]|nr:hypothetical protein [Thermoplasmata archaeon]
MNVQRGSARGRRAHAGGGAAWGWTIAVATIAVLNILPGLGTGTVVPTPYRGAVAVHFLPAAQGCGHLRAVSPGFSLAHGTGSVGSGTTRAWACPTFAGIAGSGSASVTSSLVVAVHLSIAPGVRNLTVTVVHHVAMAGSFVVSGGCPTHSVNTSTSQFFNGGEYWQNRTGFFGGCTVAAQSAMRVYLLLIDATNGTTVYIPPSSAVGCSLSNLVYCEGGIQKVAFRVQQIDYGFERDTVHNASGWHYRNYTYSSNGTTSAGPGWNVTHLDRDVVTWHYSFVRGHVYALLADFAGFAESEFVGFPNGHVSASFSGGPPSTGVSIPTITVT